MPIFGMQDIDPLFDSMSKANQETVLSLAHGQANSFVPALQASAVEAVAPLKASGQTRVVPQNADQLDADDFNWAMSEAHEVVLRSLFVMGFCQGFCLKHRLMALETSMYSFFGTDEGEDEFEDDLDSLSDDDEEDTDADDVRSREITDAD